MNRPFFRIAATALLTIVAGCSSGGTVLQPRPTAPTASPRPIASASPEPSPSQTPSAQPTPTASPTTAAGTLGRVYVTNEYGNSVTIYQPTASGTQNLAPVATIVGSATGLDIPDGVALDAAGNIYVLNQYAATVGSITVYPPNPSGSTNEAPIATISGGATGLSYPSAIAVDANGYIYAGNNNNTVTVYAPNPSGAMNEAPYEIIGGSATGLAFPKGIAVDAAGLIYVANDNNTSTESGNTVGSITVYSARTAGTQNLAPLGTIFGSSTGLDFPSGIALDASDRIFTTSGATGTIQGFAQNPTPNDNEAPFATISDADRDLEANAVALDAAGRIYTTDPGGTGDPDSVAVYAANPSGTLTETPIVTITGAATNLNRPAAIYVR